MLDCGTCVGRDASGLHAAVNPDHQQADAHPRGALTALYMGATRGDPHWEPINTGIPGTCDAYVLMWANGIPEPRVCQSQHPPRGRCATCPRAYDTRCSKSKPRVFKQAFTHKHAHMCFAGQGGQVIQTQHIVSGEGGGAIPFDAQTPPRHLTSGDAAGTPTLS